ncbi:hypothetical protein Tco_0935686, partial [Tanacetum coccineum]
NFLPLKHDLSFSSLDEFVNEPIVSEPTVKKPVVETSEAKDSADKPKVVMMNNWEKGVIDSRCSRHMARNMSYLTDFKEIDGGYVAFGGNPKGGKITGKGTIKTGTKACDDAGINLLLLGKVNAARHNLQLLVNFVDTHNLVAFLAKPAESEGFEQIVDFLNAQTIKYALTVNPTIYTSCIEQFWATVKVKTINREVQLQALVDGKKIIVTEAFVRSDLQLNDEEGTYCLPNATIFEELTRMGTVKNLDNAGKFLMYLRSRRTKRKDTEVPQPSGPSTKVVDEAVYEERDDSLERATTSATSLDAEQDRGGGPRRQETMGDTIAQTRSENISKLSNVPLLTRGNTLRNGEDRLKLQELMELCTNLQNRVIDLENTKTAQAQEIRSLKLGVKKLEKKGGSRTHKFKRLYKGRKIDNIDKDAEITLVDEIHGRYGDDIMFDVSDLAGEEAKIQDKGKAKMFEPELVKKLSKKDQLKLDEEVAQRLQAEFDEQKRIEKEKAKANIALKDTWDDIQAKIKVDQLLAERLQTREQEELTVEERAILFQQLLKKRRKHFVAKRAEEKRNIPPTKAQQRSIITELVEGSLKKADAEIAQESSSKRAGDELEQESIKKQKVDEDKETSELKSLMEVILDEEEVAVDAIPLATKPPTIVD